jgi:hypothetical protein
MNAMEKGWGFLINKEEAPACLITINNQFEEMEK